MADSKFPLHLRMALVFGAIVVLTLLIAVLALSGRWPTPKSESAQDRFTRLALEGKRHLDRGAFDAAIAALAEAVRLQPTHPDARLNLANAYLRAGQPDRALEQAQQALQLDPNSAAAYYLVGCAHLRRGEAEQAIQALQQAKSIDVTVDAVTYQLGRAYQMRGLLEEARAQFEELIQFEPNHLAVHYNLSQVLARLGDEAGAAQALATHQRLTAGRTGLGDPATFEQCKYTEIRTPFRLQQPVARPIPVRFSDMTDAAFGPAGTNWRGPVAVIDFNHDGRNSLFVAEPGGFRLLINSNGLFSPADQSFTNLPGNQYHQALVADLNNDQVDDVMVLGQPGSQIFKFNTNGTATDISMFARFKDVAARQGVLVDLDFTAKLDLLFVAPQTGAVQGLRNLGHPYFTAHTNTGLPADLHQVGQLALEDWNGDDLLDLFVVQEGRPPLLFVKVRGGTFSLTNTPADWPVAQALAVGDLNNDLWPDLVAATSNAILVVFNHSTQRSRLPTGTWTAQQVLLVDYDNDGWLDIVAAGTGLRLWRNMGQAGFRELTAEVGLKAVAQAAVQSVAAADLDNDGDTDLVVTRADGAIRLLRNDGGNANQLLKLHLVGNRSNASGLGIRVDIQTGGLRLTRRVGTLPIEIGVGTNRQIESLATRWFSLTLNNVDVKVDPRSVLRLDELTIRDGSCPFLYAWDGRQFRFVTDILGAAPLGLRLDDTKFTEADPEEYVWVGSEAMFPPRAGVHVLQITEELREVLYLDEAKLVVVDHPPDTEVHPTSKLVPSRPFPKSQLLTLHRRYPLRRAVTDQGLDVTERLQAADGQMVSPARVRIPQLFGLAEPHSVTLDFGPLPVDRPLVLALTGWLRFGGGTVNAAAAREPDLPFPFPRLEVETGPDQWQPVDVVVGAPAGKTKTILVELAGRLPPGSQRLRLATAFEIHWERIALFERADSASTRIAVVPPSRAELHWRGFSQYEELPWYYPHTPSYAAVRSTPPWRITPMGWCTRYGDVTELIDRADDAFALLNGGDELTLEFRADSLPPKPEGMVRDFFLWAVGWDKDADFHCEKGWLVEPLPWRGMDDQRYGQQARPPLPADALMRKYTTRWVGPYAPVAQPGWPALASRRPDPQAQRAQTPLARQPASR
jgi:Flp pilus assembly protein TadD